MARTTLLLAAPPPPPALLHVLLLLLLLLGTAAATTTPSSSDPTSNQQEQQQQQQQQQASSPSSSSSTSSPAPAGAGAGATAPPPPPTVGFYKGMSREFVNEHNKVRTKYNAPTLAWDKTLALYARRWAAVIQQDCDQARHSPQSTPLGYGECFFVGNNGTAEDALCSWEREEFIYEKGTDHCTSGHDFRDCGHFIIMIDKTFHYVGCGRAPCLSGPRHGQFFISCNYSRVKPNTTTTNVNPS